jgi:hypothetical protein
LNETDDDGLGEHKDINDELERTQELPISDLPYLSVPLFRLNENGLQEVAGVLKYCIAIFDREKYNHVVKDQTEQDAEFERTYTDFEHQIEDMIKLFDMSQDLVVRAYVISAEGLTPHASDHELSSYIWSNVSPDDHPQYSCCDHKNVRSHTLFPDFNVVHKYGAVRFPEHAQLRLKVVERTQGTFGGEDDVEIGSTMIDLEDRYFHPLYTKMVKDQVTPVEARRILQHGSSLARGHLRLWVDVLHGSERENIKEKILPSTDPVDYELRIIIWKMTDLLTHDGSYAYTTVRMRIVQDSGEDIEKLTDCHKDTLDGRATFNWRSIFPMKIPCRTDKLRIEAINIGQLGLSQDLIGEVTLNLSADYAEAKRSGAEVVLPRGLIQMHHPSEAGRVTGVLDMQGIILHHSEARARPQGEARAEPNEDPYLNPDDPHLLKGRKTMFNNIASGFVHTATMAMTLAKYGLTARLLMMAGGGILTCIAGSTGIIILSQK